MSILYRPSEKPEQTEKELLKIIALGQAGIIRAMGMQEDNAAARSFERDNFWNAGHFDELAGSIEKDVAAIIPTAEEAPEPPAESGRCPKIRDVFYIVAYLAACLWLLYKAWDIGVLL